MADPVAVKRALARLASDADADRAVISQAETAVADLDAAVAFVEDVGVARLAVAVERQRTAGNTDAVTRGERALEAFRRYRRAAGTTEDGPPAGEDLPDRPGEPDRSDDTVPALRERSNGGTNGTTGTETVDRTVESWSRQPSEAATAPGIRSGNDPDDERGLDGWRTLDGDQFHSGSGTDLGPAPERDRR